jgi:hypothetical protein
MPRVEPKKLHLEPYYPKEGPAAKWKQLELPPDWAAKDMEAEDMVRKLTEWSAHMYNWGIEVKRMVDRHDAALEELPPVDELDPPPKPPFGDD